MAVKKPGLGKGLDSLIPTSVIKPVATEASVNEKKENISNVNNEENVTDTIRLGNYVTVQNGSTLYQTPNLDGSRGIVGQNGYDSETLFKVNAVIYVDEDNNEKSFNLVQKDEQSKKQIEEEHKKYIESHDNIKVKSYHITPCDELGLPVDKNQKDIDLGGWTNNDNTKFENVELKSVVMDAYKSLGGKVM